MPILVQVDILELLTAAGIAVTETDERLSSPLHLAAKGHNHVLMRALLAEDSGTAESINEFKMTPLAAAFWNYEKSSNMRKTVEELMKAGSDPNVLLPCKEFSYLQDGYVPKAKHERDFYWPESYPYSITPLILAVIHRDGAMMSDLLKQSKNPADVNLADTNGMTPLMHAVKTNDTNIVLRLLNKEGGLPVDTATNETLPLDKILRKKPFGSFVTSGVNVGAQVNLHS